MSARAASLGLLLASLQAGAESVRVLVAIGAPVGDASEETLRYAGSDAARVRAAFVEIGNVSEDRTYLLVDAPLAKVRETLVEVSGRLAEIKSQGDEGVLIVYVSGHASGGELHLRGERWAMSELRELVQRSQAQLRVVIVDACESGAIARKKGARLVPEFSVSLQHLRLSGQVVVTSSGPGEPSQEWDSLGGSLFTHHLLTGLRGDADAESDGRVTLAEVYAYAYRRTVASAAHRAQHPAVDLDLSGAGEVVLTEPARARTAVLFPPALEGSYVVASQPRPDVVVEVEKRAGQGVRIAVPPGNYLLRKRTGNVVGLLDLDLAFGGEVTVDETRLIKTHFAEARMKGGYIELLPYAATLGAALTSEQLEGTGPRLTGEAQVRHAWGQWWAGAGIELGASTFRGRAISVQEWSGAAAVRGGYRWISVPFNFSLGGTVEARLLRQSFARDAEAAIREVYPALPAVWVTGTAAGANGAVEIPISHRWVLMVGGEVLVRYLKAAGQVPWSLGARMRAAVGVRF